MLLNCFSAIQSTDGLVLNRILFRFPLRKMSYLQICRRVQSKSTFPETLFNLSSWVDSGRLHSEDIQRIMFSMITAFILFQNLFKIIDDILFTFIINTNILITIIIISLSPLVLLVYIINTINIIVILLSLSTSSHHITIISCNNNAYG